MIRWRGKLGPEEAGHLLRRAVFAPAPGEVDRAVKEGLEATVDRLIGAALPKPTDIEQAIRSSDEHATLAGAILHRLATSPAPLRENVALFFHNHFVSSLSKVREGRMMLDQMALFRALGLGPFRDLARAVARDPAMVRYLDLERSSRSEPNENFARELFELFTTGPGPYTEQDIKEAARAFTGHHLRGGRFILSEAAHDPGLKTVLGQFGRWTGEDVVTIAASHAATARFMARKLARHFIADEPSDRTVDELEQAWMKQDGHLGGLLKAVFLSESFFAPEHRFAVTRSPAALIAAAARGLGSGLAPLAAAQHCVAMGQALLDPPTVKGYPGGRKWMNAATLLARRVFLLEALRSAPKDGPYAVLVMAAAAGVEPAFRIVYGRAPAPDEEQAVSAGIAGTPGNRAPEVVELLVLHPLFQRC